MKIKSSKRDAPLPETTEPLAQKKHLIPIHRHAFKGKYLQKHASLLHNSQSVHGILISCTSKSETSAIGQARAFLQEMLDTLYPDAVALWPEKPHELDVDLGIVAVNSNDDEALVEKEVDATAEKRDKMFQLVDTGCSGLIFVRFRNDILPSAFMLRVFEHIRLEAQQLSLSRVSHCTRFIPIDRVCNSNLTDIRLLVTPLLLQHFTQKANRTIRVIAECRNNVDLSTTSLRDLVLDCIPNDCGVRVDLTEATDTLLISVFKSVAGFSILSGYGDYKKYNIHNACKVAQ